MLLIFTVLSRSYRDNMCRFTFTITLTQLKGSFGIGPIELPSISTGCCLQTKNRRRSFLCSYTEHMESRELSL